jgi:hypothetical protein
MKARDVLAAGRQELEIAEKLATWGNRKTDDPKRGLNQDSGVLAGLLGSVVSHGKRGKCGQVNGYFLGGYFSMDFFTMSSSLPSIFVGSLFSSLAMARQTRERVEGSRKSITRVPSL